MFDTSRDDRFLANFSKNEIEYEPRSMNIDDDDDIDYTTTPEEDRVPLFPHEAPGPTDKVADSLESRRVSSASTPLDPPRQGRENFNDPTLLPFPTDREGVFAQIYTLERQLPPDSALPGSIPGSPALGTLTNSRSFERFDMPSPRLLGNSSPSLHAISEGKEVEQVSLNSRRHRNSALRSVSSQQDITQDSLYSNDEKSPTSDVTTEPKYASRELESPSSTVEEDTKETATKNDSSDSVIHHDIQASAQDTTSEQETSNKEDEPSESNDKSIIDTVRNTIPDQISPFSSTEKNTKLEASGKEDGTSEPNDKSITDTVRKAIPDQISPFSSTEKDTEQETSNKEDKTSEPHDNPIIDTVRNAIPDQISPFSSTEKNTDQATKSDLAVPSDSTSSSGHISMNSDGASDEPVHKTGEESPRPSLIERRQGSSQSLIKDFALSHKPTDSGDKETATDHPSIEIDRVSPHKTPVNAAQAKSGNSLLTTVAPAVLTPFIVGGERRLGHSSERVEPPVSVEAPTITLQPATPRSSIRTVGTDPTDTPSKAESTGSSTGTGSDLVSRKKQRAMSPTPDRPLTPGSMRSTKDVKDKNFLKAFWRVVFVDWIGGLIARLCGGGRDA
jgi:hypothetical protein